MSYLIEEHVLRRYEIVKKCGRSHWKALDKKTKKLVFIRMVFDVLRDQFDARNTLNELLVLEELAGHDGIISVYSTIHSKNDRDIYIIYEYIDTSLYAVLKRQNTLTDQHKRYILYQILRAFKYIHSAGLVYKFLRPANILLDSNCQVKITDFSYTESASKPNRTGQEFFFISWYLAPEILLGSKTYSTEADMWSIGCVLAEMLKGGPIFPGKTYSDQLEKILKFTGIPSREDQQSINTKYVISLLDTIPQNESRVPVFLDFFGSVSDEALDLVLKLLQFNPNKRLTAEQALSHPYVSEFHEPSSEPSSKKAFQVSLDHFSLAECRDKIYSDFIRRN